MAESLREEIDNVLRDKGYDIWSVAGKDGIEQFLQEELTQILSRTIKRVKEIENPWEALIVDEPQTDIERLQNMGYLTHNTTIQAVIKVLEE